MQRPALVGSADGLTVGLGVGVAVGLTVGTGAGTESSAAAWAVPAFKTIPTPCTTGSDRITGATHLTSDSRRVMGAENAGVDGPCAAAGLVSTPRRRTSSLSASSSARSSSLVFDPPPPLKTVHLWTGAYMGA